MDTQTKEQVNRLLSYTKAAALLVGIYIGSAIARLQSTALGSSAVTAWRVVESLCLFGGVALVLLARRKYDTLVGKDPSTRSFLRLG